MSTEHEAVTTCRSEYGIVGKPQTPERRRRGGYEAQGMLNLPMTSEPSSTGRRRSPEPAERDPSLGIPWWLDDVVRSGEAAETRYRYLPALAGVAYVLAWISGLLVWPLNLAIDATGRQIQGPYAHHTTQATVQYILVEGVAGVLLATVLIYALRALQRQRPEPRTRFPMLLGLGAAAISVLQCVLGLELIASLSAREVTRGGDLFALVNRLDGVKQLLLAATALWLATKASRVVLPRWLRVTALILTIALIPSGLAYLLLLNSFAWTASAALLMLLIFISGSGLWLTRTHRVC